MMHLFINGLAASAGGGLTYLRNVIPHLARRSDVTTSILMDPALQAEFDSTFGGASEGTGNISWVEGPKSAGLTNRVVFEQTRLRGLLQRSGANVLLSAGNFALWNSPVPQILLSRNSLYTSSDFQRDVRDRGAWFLLIDTALKGWIARESIARADITVAPSESFAQELTQWTGRQVLALHHGFDSAAFTRDRTPLPAQVQDQLAQAKDALRLLFVSHYNYYRNFETLFRAVPLLRQRSKGARVKLFLTCELSSGKNPGSYRTDSAASLLRESRGSDTVVELGTIPYRSLHHLFRACHIYVTPAYTESFAHPLVEAMSSGLPVVASDLPVHREICGNAALYFQRFSAEDFAESVLRIAESPDLAKQLSSNGLERSKAFSWEKHVDRLLALARSLCS